MEVSQIAELDSHVVIGGASAHAFGMSDSAEFFTVLSDTLYREKKLAVVREVVCNGDDAHKMVGREDLPVEISLSDTELVVKDFGPGIADDRMVGIYCIYGASTKVKQENQTGGFGLGSKAPFAYSDHFTVTSCHKGVKSVYAISRGGIDTDGKPSLVRMVQSPTEESGLTVSIPLKTSTDRHEFDRLIRTVVAHGGINARLNGEKLPAFDFSKVPAGSFCMAHTPTLTESPVYVKYGAVLYPVIVNDPAVAKLVNEFRGPDATHVIIHARPNTIGIAPSRENLSNSDRTIATLKELLKDIKGKLLAHRDEALKMLADRVVDQAQDGYVPFSINSGFHAQMAKFPTFSTDPVEMSMQALWASIRAYNGYEWMKPSSAKLTKELMLAGARRFRDSRRMFRRLASPKIRKTLPNLSGWKSGTNDLALRVLVKTGTMEKALTYGYKEYSPGETDYRRGGRGIHPVRYVSGWRSKNHFVLCRGKEQASGWLEANRYKNDSGKQAIFLVVRNLKPAQIEEIKAAVNHYKLKLTVLDIAPPARAPKKPKVEAPKHKFYELAQVEGSGDYAHISLRHCTAELTDAPVFIDMKTTNVDTEMHRFEIRPFLKEKDLLLKVYPKVALAYGQVQKKQLIAQGSRELQEVMREDYLALPDTPDIHFIYAAARKKLAADDNLYGPGRLASKLMESDMRFAKLLTGRRVVVSPKEMKAHALFRIHGKVSIPDPNGEVLEKIRNLTNTVSKHTQKKSGYFDFLAPLTNFWGHWGRDGEISYTEDLVEMIKFLQRRAKSRPASIQTAKEAA